MLFHLGTHHDGGMAISRKYFPIIPSRVALGNETV